MGLLFSRLPNPSDARGKPATVAPAASATRIEPAADAGDLVARALEILDQEAAAWQARQPAGPSIGRAR